MASGAAQGHFVVIGKKLPFSKMASGNLRQGKNFYVGRNTNSHTQKPRFRVKTAADGMKPRLRHKTIG
ncbi:MAG: hypothetical protein M0P19_02465 [Nevskia sp.]|nr:hypothetical protein [Nevskia sp.]MCK9386034.1 hypothetical protein [Nevskia sp.]